MTEVIIMNGDTDVTNYYTIVTVNGTLKVTGSITYDANGGSGNVPVDDNEYDLDAEITLKDAGKLERENAVFLGWSDEPVELVQSSEEEAAAGILPDTITMGEEDITVYAVWALDSNGPEGKTDEIPDYLEYAVTYMGNGGSGNVTDTNLYPVDYEVVLLDNGFTRSGFNYRGWGIDAAGSSVYQPGAVLKMAEGGLVLYAQWQKIYYPEPQPEEPEAPAAETAVLGDAAAPEVGVLGESKGPGTADTAPVTGWLALAAGAAAVLAAYGKKRRKAEK